jgi:hypothetical protein
MPANAVVSWFGQDFSQFHPLLQQLHRDGGTLTGSVELSVPSGLAGWVGRRLAGKLGIPSQAGRYPFEVIIEHREGRLLWSRRFAASHSMLSTFEPVGSHVSGYWKEVTGHTELHLQVDIQDGGWHWRCVGMRVRGLPLPLWLAPRTLAYKEVVGGAYRFYVGFSLPLLGTLLSYSGLLQAANVQASPALQAGAQ